jgi:hypothetical protein
MKQDRDYISGPHHFWIHFWCGLVFGGVLGTGWSWQVFESGLLIFVGGAVTALVIAFCCGRWGDSVWHWILEQLPWIT